MNWARIGFMVSIMFFILALVVLALSQAPDKNLEKTIQGQTSKIEYQGHTYIVWALSQAGGIVHDPDCACERGKE